jgi:hypothetical protein
MFHIGDKVVCIDSSMQPHTVEELKRDVPNWVKQDEKYTIRGFNDNSGIVVGVLLEEIHNMPIYFKLLGKAQEPAFAEWRFRKLKPNEIENEVESEVEVLEEILQEIN